MAPNIPSDKITLSSTLMRRYHFFVSYSGANYSDAEAITEILQTKGLRVFLDRDSGRFDRAPRQKGDPRGNPIPGTPDIIGDVLWQELVHSLALLLICTRRSYSSSWVAQEFRVFHCQHRPILVWHSDGDFWNSPPFLEEQYAFSREEYQAVAGYVEIAWILQHIPESRDQIDQVARRILLWLDLMELAEWHGVDLTCENVENQSQERNALLFRYSELQEQHVRKYGKEMPISRQPHPYTDGIPVRRKDRHPPFLVKAVQLLERAIQTKA